jgi:hypothetical protein
LPTPSAGEAFVELGNKVAEELAFRLVRMVEEKVSVSETASQESLPRESSSERDALEVDGSERGGSGRRSFFMGLRSNASATPPPAKNGRRGR